MEWLLGVFFDMNRVSITISDSRGNAIHNSFNRAMTIHGITGVIAEQCVTYDIKGLSFFIEDGIEENNIVRTKVYLTSKSNNLFSIKCKIRYAALQHNFL